MRAVETAAVVGVLVAAVAGCSRSAARREPPDPLASKDVDVAASPVLASADASPGPACGDPGDVLLFATPARSIAGQPLRVVAVTDRRVDASLAIGGSVAPFVADERHGGPPYFWIAEVDAAARGKLVATLARSGACGGAVLATKEVAVHEGPLAPPVPPRTAVWRTRAAWSPGLENLYSAWVESLFEAPLDAAPSYAALHEVLRDRAKNFLFDHLGAAEDEQGV